MLWGEQAVADQHAQLASSAAFLASQPLRKPQGLRPSPDPSHPGGPSGTGGARQRGGDAASAALRGARAIAEHREYLAYTAVELQRLAERLAAAQGALAGRVCDVGP